MRRYWVAVGFRLWGGEWVECDLPKEERVAWGEREEAQAQVDRLESLGLKGIRFEVLEKIVQKP